MAKTISKKRSVKASASKPSGKNPTGDKTFGIDPAIRFYAIEDGDDTEQVEEAEILVVYNSILAASKQNLVNRKLIYINTFNHKLAVVIRTMRNLSIGVFEHLKITSPMHVDKRLEYTQHILRGAALKKYREVLGTCELLDAR